MLYVILIAGLYLLLIFAIMSTKNFRSFLFFRFTPMILGSVLVVYSLMHMEFLQKLAA